MDKCQRQRITLNSLRGLLSAAVGTAAGVGAYFTASHLAVDLNVAVDVAIGLAVTAATWFGSSSKFQFTQECLDMKEGAELRRIAPVKIGKTGSKTALPVQPPARVQSKPAAAVKAVSKAMSPALLNIGSLFDRGNVSITVQEVEGEKVVVVKTKNLSSSQFKGNNGLRNRLEKIAGISWENPKNAEGVRSMSGKVTKGANESEICEKLVSTCERFA